MKEEFLKKLRTTLDEHKVQNVDEILKKYENRFFLGYEAGMKDEEIIEAMESIEEIVAQYQPNKNYQLFLDLTMFSDFEIIYNDDLKQPFHFDLDIDPFDFDDEENKVKEYVQIVEENHSISLKNIKKCEEELCGTLYIDPKSEFDKIFIENDSCDLFIENLEVKVIGIKNCSGDLEIHKLQANSIEIETISGDVEINELISDHLTLASTSGDVSIGRLKVEKIDISTVSGDIEIEQLDAGSGKISSVSGDIAYSLGEQPIKDVDITTVSGTIEEE